MVGDIFRPVDEMQIDVIPVVIFDLGRFLVAESERFFHVDAKTSLIAGSPGNPEVIIIIMVVVDMLMMMAVVVRDGGGDGDDGGVGGGDDDDDDDVGGGGERW